MTVLEPVPELPCPIGPSLEQTFKKLHGLIYYQLTGTRSRKNYSILHFAFTVFCMTTLVLRRHPPERVSNGSLPRLQSCRRTLHTSTLDESLSYIILRVCPPTILRIDPSGRETMSPTTSHSRLALPRPPLGQALFMCARYRCAIQDRAARQVRASVPFPRSGDPTCSAVAVGVITKADPRKPGAIKRENDGCVTKKYPEQTQETALALSRTHGHRKNRPKQSQRIPSHDSP